MGRGADAALISIAPSRGAVLLVTRYTYLRGTRATCGLVFYDARCNKFVRRALKADNNQDTRSRTCTRDTVI